MDRKDEGGARKMKRLPFLNQAEICALQHQEAQSNKTQKRTAEQIEAIYSSGQNILVSASAGSGKTFVMVQRIIDQIMRGVRIEQLFISTFTVKAASELKERLEKELSKVLKETTNEELKQHLAQQLADIPNADIGTMDSFTQKVLNKYGYLLELAPNFRILQSASEQLLLQNEVFEQVFEDFYQSDQAALFKKMVKNFTGQRKDLYGFREQVYKIYSFLQSTSNPIEWLEKDFLKGYEFADFQEEKAQLLTKTKETLFDLEDFFRYHLIHEAKEFPKAKYLENVQRVLDGLASLQGHSSEEVYLTALNHIVEISRASNGKALTNSGRKEELKEIINAYNEKRKEKIQVLRDLADQFYRFEFQMTYHEEAKEILLVLQQFMKSFVTSYLNRKKEENAFEFADISHFAIQILEECSDVRQFYRNKYHEVMVDEYQDTNHTQERMLELLSNGDNRFMVGDIKQSIYRFRQADPQIFNEKFKTYKEDSSQGKLIVLKENFRSHLEVLEATNDVFKRLMDEEVGEIDYNETHYLVAGNPDKKEPNPLYQTEFLIYDGALEADKEENDKEVSSVSAGEVELVIKEIIRLYNEENVQFEDITLLTASRTRNDVILAEFAKYGIPVVSDGGEDNYLQSVEVMVMLDTLRTINNPLNDYALVALLKSPMFNFTEDELARLALQKKVTEANYVAHQENLYEKLKNALNGYGQYPELITPPLLKKIQQFQGTLQAWREYAKTNSLYDLLWKIYQDRFYYDYVGALPNGAGRQANLYALTLRANDYEKISFKGLSRFIGMIDKILETQNDLASVVSAAPKHAVRLMTVHKSKGLEFKYVFLLNMDKVFNRKDGSSALILSRQNGVGIKYVADVAVDVADKLAPNHVRLSIDTLPYEQNEREIHLASISEQMRLLYVAMTRAERKLYLVGKGHQNSLEKKSFPTPVKGHLAASIRQSMTSFQDWMWALHVVFEKDNLAFSTRFVTDNDLISEKIGQLKLKDAVIEEDLIDNRQSEDIRRALDILENVDRLNTQYRAAIHLPSVQTPSQIKKFYEPVIDTDGVEIMEKRNPTIVGKASFELPNFAKKAPVTGAQIGSAVHELMQRIPLDQAPTIAILRKVLKQVQAEASVKKKIDLQKIASFFGTELGQLLLKYTDRVYREAPFAMLKQDPASGQDFVVRGILDGYLLLADRIILFDYKTDQYTHSSELVKRYQGQLALYAEALRRSYGIEKIEKYLVLLGESQLQVVKVD